MNCRSMITIEILWNSKLCKHYYWRCSGCPKSYDNWTKFI